MGRSYTPTFKLSIATTEHYCTPSAWDVRARHGCRGNGQPTDANLEKWVKEFEQSCIDGANKHLGPMTIVLARITRQSTGKIMASYVREDNELPAM